MIKAEFLIKPETNDITHVRISGHAGQNVYGHDVVCAGVSTLIIATINGLEEYVGIRANAVVKEGFTEFSIQASNKTQSLQAQALVHSLHLAMLELQKEYTDFVKVTIMEEKI